MAVIRAVVTAGGRKLQVIVRKGGHALSRTFWRQREAEDWARRVEDAIAAATPTIPFNRKAWLPFSAAQAEAESFDESCPHGGWTVGRALDEFKVTVSAKRKGAVEESYRIEFWKGTAIGRKKFCEVTAGDVQAVIDDRLTTRKGDTVRRETNVLRSLFRHAREECKVPGLTSLSSVAREIVDRLTLAQPAQAKIFRISDSARRRTWKMAREKAKVADLRWHDLRHEAISRMMETLHVFDVMQQAGHRDVESTKGYSHGKASDIAKKLG